MHRKATLDKLADLLKQAGVNTLALADARAAGFATPIPTKLGDLFLDLPMPAFLAELQPEELGLAIVDKDGNPQSTWGLAEKLPYFRRGSSLLKTPLSELIEDGGSLYLDGIRYFASGGGSSGRETIVLVVNAYEEKKARRQASKGWRVASTLKRLGKALTSNRSVKTVCVAAAHEIASSTDLAAALIWVLNEQGSGLELAASVGVNRKGTMAVSNLALAGGRGCVAEMVADSGRVVLLSDLFDHTLTQNLEANFTYLKAKGLFVAPLKIAERIVGVVELVGKDGDPFFEDNAELFETVAEHLSLALNSAWLYEQAERSASIDSLTGIPNHRSMQQFLHAGLATADRKNEEFSAVMIDVDHFRSFNEEEGHDAGDSVLQAVAQALRSCVRPGDLAARYGGEEFTLLLPSTGAEGAARVAERARVAVESMDFRLPSGRARPVTISLGYATYPQAASDSVGLLKAADTALYEAKRLGRNQVVEFEGSVRFESPKPGIDLDAVLARLRGEDRAAGRELLTASEALIVKLAKPLSLTEPQCELLRGLMLTLPAYREAWGRADISAIEAFEAAPEFRLLAQSLAAYHECFDGTGPRGLRGDRIPLLARVAQVIIAAVEERSLGSSCLDPQIVAAFTGFADAA